MSLCVSFYVFFFCFFFLPLYRSSLLVFPFFFEKSLSLSLLLNWVLLVVALERLESGFVFLEVTRFEVD